MRLTKPVALWMVVLVLGAVPAVALAGGPGDSGTPGHDQTATTTNTSSDSTESAKAYGKYCHSESKKHVADQKGTPFSQCVTAAEHAAKNSKTSASEACNGLSKKHVRDQKGTPFGECVSAIAKLRGKS